MLDDRRLGKQRVETLQIMQVLLGLRWDTAAGVIETYEPRGWRTHPAVLMWQGSESALGRYQELICQEWTGRGFGDTCAVKTAGLLRAAGRWQDGDASGRHEMAPSWLGDQDLHRSHQSNLVRKDPDHYRRLFPDVPDDLPYVWPVSGPADPPR